MIRTARRLKFDAPSQPDPSMEEESEIVLRSGDNFEQALHDLEGFERIWLIWWFHKNETWRPMVLPPRGDAKKRGVLATRSPHRPNPIGISAVSLRRICGRSLFVGPNDLLDGTPILDIKPYIPRVDAFPESRFGWLEEIEEGGKQQPYTVEFGLRAREQLDWLRSKWQIDLMARAGAILGRDPSPHRTRRISRRPDGGFRMGCGAWRLYFDLVGTIVTVHRITPGYPERSLLADDGKIPQIEAQRAFSLRWPAEDPR